MLSFNKITQAVVFTAAMSLTVQFKPYTIQVQPSFEMPVMAAYHPEPPEELDGGSRFSGGEKQEQKSRISDFSDDSYRVRGEA